MHHAGMVLWTPTFLCFLRARNILSFFGVKPVFGIQTKIVANRTGDNLKNIKGSQFKHKDFTWTQHGEDVHGSFDITDTV